MLYGLAVLKHPRADRVVLFVPVWVLALAIGCTPRRVEQVLDVRTESGRLLARWLGRRAWFTSNLGETRIGGTVWAVRTRTALPDGQAVRVLANEVRHDWRDLGGDVKAGLTRFGITSAGGDQERGWQVAQQMALRGDSIHVVEAHGEASVWGGLAGPTYGLEIGTGAAERDAVTEFARAATLALNDGGSHRFWARVGWAVIRAARAGRELHGRLLGVLERAVAAMREGWARNGAALAAKEVMAWPALAL